MGILREPTAAELQDNAGDGGLIPLNKVSPAKMFEKELAKVR